MRDEFRFEVTLDEVKVPSKVTPTVKSEENITKTELLTFLNQISQEMDLETINNSQSLNVMMSTFKLQIVSAFQILS